MMIDHNTLFYTFSTMAQVLAAILAITAVFVFAKNNEYRQKMQREMSNVVKEFDKLLNSGSSSEISELENWRTQATKAERHGVIPEMKNIFVEHSKRSQFGQKMIDACKYGLRNYNLNEKLINGFRKLVYFGLFSISIDFLLLSFTSECNVDHYRIVAYSALYLNLVLTICFLICMAAYIRTTTIENN